MSEDVGYHKMILALQKTIVATFDDGKWRELGYLTDSIDIISGHHRLLRSLYWGDSDYSGNVFQILPRIIEHDSKKLKVVEEYVGLREWLKENDRTLYDEIYGEANVIPLENVEATAIKLDVIDLNKHAARIRKGIREDPEQAIGSAKELLETVLKVILEIREKTSDDIPALLKKALTKLGLNPRSSGSAIAGSEIIKRTINNLGQVVVGVAEFRNLYGTGHGRVGSKELEIAHARLVVNAAVSIATFLLEIASG